MADIIQLRRDTAINFTTANPILAQGEPALEIDTLKEKIGDGLTNWIGLPYRIGNESFLDSTDTPTTYLGQAGKSVIVNATETGVEFGIDTIPTLQQVVDETEGIGYMVGGVGFEGYNSWIAPNQFALNKNNDWITIRPDSIEMAGLGQAESVFLITENYNSGTFMGSTIVFPSKSGTIALANLQKEIIANYPIVDADNEYTIFFNSATPITVTINTLTKNNFSCDFYNLGVGAVTFVNGTATVDYPDGTILNTDKVCSLIRFMATATYKLKGELV